MMKPSLPQGTRDFGPDVVRKRQYILNTIKSVFELYGFQPLETPAMENLETLMGKYGEEGDKLIFKILNNGLDNPAKEQQAREEFEKVLQGKNTKSITERALKYDLTIPFARYVAMNHNQLTFPFKRYQVQPVWRADRPQKGRYREFYQCDADVVGSNALINEVEFVNIYNEVFQKLKIQDYELRINSRKILTALAEIAGGLDKMMAITVAIDKLDKIGIEKVKEELSQRGLSKDQIRVVENYLDVNGTNEEKLSQIKNLLGHCENGKKGIEEIQFVVNTSSDTKIETQNPIIDFTLARGLNYYTGIIFEAKAPSEVKIGSIGGGGRYDDLTGMFGLKGLTGVGISFGADRIYDVMDELNLFPAAASQGTQVLICCIDKDGEQYALPLLQQLREKNIYAELYPAGAKIKKQMEYANNKQIPYTILIGSEEMQSGLLAFKDMASGLQEKLSAQQILQKLTA